MGIKLRESHTQLFLIYRSGEQTAAGCAAGRVDEVAGALGNMSGNAISSGPDFRALDTVKMAASLSLSRVSRP